MVRVPAVALLLSTCSPICATVPLSTRAFCSNDGGVPNDQLPGVNQLPLVGPCQISCADEAVDPIKIKLKTTGQRLAGRISTRNRIQPYKYPFRRKSLPNIAIQVSETCHV